MDISFLWQNNNKAGMMKIKYLYLTITIVVKMVSVKNHRWMLKLVGRCAVKQDSCLLPRCWLINY